MRVCALLALAGCSFTHGTLVDAAGDEGAEPDGRSACPVGFASLPNAPPGSMYKAFGAQSFTMAVNTCKTAGTHLVQLDTHGEADAVYTMIDSSTTTPGDTHMYRVVGQRDKSVTPNRWLDLDSTPITFLPWGMTEPTNGLNEDCILLRLEGATTVKVIGADQCGTNHEYACECE